MKISTRLLLLAVVPSFFFRQQYMASNSTSCPVGLVSLEEDLKRDSFKMNFGSAAEKDVFLVKPVAGNAAKFNAKICSIVGLPCGGDILCTVPNKIKKGSKEIFTTAQMHRYNPDFQEATQEQYYKFLSEYAVAIFKTRVFGVTGLQPFNVFVNQQTQKAVFFDCDAVSQPYLISHPFHSERTPPIKQRDFQQLDNWLESNQFEQLKLSYISRINTLKIDSNQFDVRKQFLSDCEARWGVIKNTVRDLSKAEGFNEKFKELLDNPPEILCPLDYGDIMGFKSSEVMVTDEGDFNIWSLHAQILS
tara:strand:- start:83 stop:994 length:912 start_codon:yes stop_codon:yes gene_type:complete